MNERGDASVEFLGILVVLVIPVLYIVLAVGQVSAGAMAVDAGAREAARILAEDPAREADASHAVALIVEDFGIDAQADVSPNCVGCEGDGGRRRRAGVRARPPALRARVAGKRRCGCVLECARARPGGGGPWVMRGASAC